MTRLFEDFYEISKLFNEFNRFSPSYKSYSVKAEGENRSLDISLLGHTKETVDVTIDSGVIKIKAKATSEMSDLTKSHDFRFKIPDDCDPEKITAKLEGGILRITLPYFEEDKSKVKKIKVL